MDCLDAIDNGDREGKLRGAEDEEEAEGNNGTLLEQADSQTRRQYMRDNLGKKRNERKLRLILLYIKTDKRFQFSSSLQQ